MSSAKDAGSKEIRLKYLLRSGLSDNQRRLLNEVDEAPFVPMEAIGERGEIDLSTTKPVEKVITGYTRFFEGDVLVAKITPCFENGKGAIVRGTGVGVGFGTTELHVLSPLSHVSSRFLYYLTAGADFRGLGQAMMSGAAGQKRVPDEFIRDYRLTLPAYSTQEAIADYLDRETATIDTMIAAKERLLKLLAEKRRALITHAVTRGLTPDVPMRDSGVEWINTVPAHWKSIKMRWLFKQEKRQDFPDLPVLSVYREYGVIVRDTRDDNANRIPEDLSRYQLVEVGDLVVNKMKAWQGSLGISEHRGITSPDYVVFTPTHNELPQYLNMLLRNRLLTTAYLSMSNGIRTSQWRLEPDRFGTLEVFLPPLHEQQEIVEQVDNQLALLDELASTAASMTALLSERRKAVISAAVTGEIDIEAIA